MKKLCRVSITAILIATAIILYTGSAFSQQHVERDYELAMARGELALETGDHAAAAEQFRLALQSKPGDEGATLYLATALSQSGDLAAAQSVLEQALAVDPADPRLHYELGVVFSKLGRQGDADRHFDAAAALPGPDLPGREAQGDPLKLSLAGGIQYDSNVLLEPDNPAASAKEQKDDWRAVMNLAGSYAFFRSGRTEAVAGYRFYQSLHAELEDFNVQQHDLNLGGRYRFSSANGIGLRYSFLYSLVSAEHYSTTHRLQLDGTRSFSRRTVTELRLGTEGKRFITGPDFPGNAERNATNSSVGLGHTIMLTRHIAVALDYAYDTDSADLDKWDSTGHKGTLFVRSALAWSTLYLTGSLYDKKYGADASAPQLPNRHDQVQEYAVTLKREIGKKAALSVSDTYVVNDSNTSAYEYKRNVIGISAEVKL